jgi:flagellar assembly factor FliW
MLIQHEANSRFRWLQSIENERLAFVLTDPLQVVPEYRAEVRKDDIVDLDLASLEKAAVLCIVNISQGCKSVTVNLVGPIIINTENMRAKQIILIDSHYSIRHNIMTAEQKEKDQPEMIRAHR